MAKLLLLLVLVAACVSMDRRPPPPRPEPPRPQPPPTRVVVTNDDGSEAVGRVVRRGGEPRLWLRVEGLTSVIWRPIRPEQVLAARPIGPPRPEPENRPRRATDAELAHGLLFSD